MEIISVTTLTPRQKVAAEALTKIVQAHDETVSKPYLSNQYNYFKEMPTFFLAYEQEQLLGLLMLYADEAPGDGEVDVHLEVLPAARRRGIATNLWRQAKTVLDEYQFEDWNFVSEKRFLQQNPDFLSNSNLRIDDSEYNMKVKSNKQISDRSDLTVAKMTESEIAQVISFYGAAFNENLVFSMRYIQESYHNKSTDNYVLKKQNEVIGFSSVDFANEYYIFGVCIDPAVQGRGYGTYFMQKLVELLHKQDARKKIELDVGCDNPAAIKVYQKAGFETTSEVEYLKK